LGGYEIVVGRKGEGKGDWCKKRMGGRWRKGKEVRR
jgi:hypothetical protein